MPSAANAATTLEAISQPRPCVPFQLPLIFGICFLPIFHLLIQQYFASQALPPARNQQI
jgi:hypothetical protein